MANQTCNPAIITEALGIQATGPRTVIVPADPIIWDAETSYEYLTLVASADFGQGYVSKKDVPSGTPLTDTEYWIPVASYNAQLAAIQEQLPVIQQQLGNKADISYVDSQVTSAKTYTDTKVEEVSSAQHVMVAIGDSFGVDSVTSPTFWHTIVAKGLGLVDKNYCEGSTGFATTNPSTQRNFAANLQRAYDDPSFDNDLVDYVVCYGGLNDRTQSSTATIRSAVTSFIDKCHKLYPKAQVVIAGPTSWYAASPVPSYDAGYGSFNVLMANILKQACETNGASFVNTTLATMGNASLYAAKADGNHFTALGSSVAGGFILMGINGSACEGQHVSSSPVTIYDEDKTQVGTGTLAFWPRSSQLSFYAVLNITQQVTAKKLYVVTDFKLVLNQPQSNAGILYDSAFTSADGFPPRIMGIGDTAPVDNALLQFAGITTTGSSAYVFVKQDWQLW